MAKETSTYGVYLNVILHEHFRVGKKPKMGVTLHKSSLAGLSYTDFLHVEELVAAVGAGGIMGIGNAIASGEIKVGTNEPRFVVDIKIRGIEQLKEGGTERLFGLSLDYPDSTLSIVRAMAQSFMGYPAPISDVGRSILNDPKQGLDNVAWAKYRTV